MLIPTYRPQCAPDGLMTRRQLRTAGLRPGGHDPIAEIEYWRYGWRHAYLYDVALALPVRPMTPGRWRAHAAMMLRRRTCPACRIDRGYCIPRSLGVCVPCSRLAEIVREFLVSAPVWRDEPGPGATNPPIAPTVPIRRGALVNTSTNTMELRNAA
jgi:hypothetical protein